MVSASLTAHETFIADALARGLYRDRQELLNAAVELLRRKQELLDRIDLGIKQLETGEYREFDDAGLMAFKEEIRARAIARLEHQSPQP